MLKAFAQMPVSDTLVQERLDAMRRWCGIREAVGVVLYLGVAATAFTYLAQLAPALEEASRALEQATRWIGASTGVLTALFLLITRYLGQLETDIWTFLSMK